MKKVFIVLAAAAALLCGCDKYGARLDNIEGRLTALEQRCEDLNANITSIGKLVEAANGNITIKDVKKLENGFQIFFSDGTSYYIVNGEKGDAPGISVAAVDGIYYWKVNGEWLTDGDGNKVPVTGVTPQLKYDGETDTWYVSMDRGETWDELGVQKTGTDITFTEDDEAYYFDFGDGNVAKISKMASFVMKVESDVVSVEAGQSVTLAYTLTGGDETTHVVAEANGYTATVDESAQTVTITAGSSIEPGYVILKAIRNSDGASSSQFVAVNSGATPPAPQETIELVITETTYNTVSFTATPSDKEMLYMVNLSTKAYIDENGLDSDEALFADEVDYFTWLGSQYEMTYQEVFDILANTGDLTDGFDDLDPETEYVLYAYGLDENYGLATPIARIVFTTPETPAGTDLYTQLLGEWIAKGTAVASSGSSEVEVKVNIVAKEQNVSYFIEGFDPEEQGVLANLDESNRCLAIPCGAPNQAGVYNFGSIGIHSICWCPCFYNTNGGLTFFTSGTVYWDVNDAGNQMVSGTSYQGEILSPLGFGFVLFDVDDSYQSTQPTASPSGGIYTYGTKYLIDSFTKVEGGQSSTSAKTNRVERFNGYQKELSIKKTRTAEESMLYIK